MSFCKNDKFQQISRPHKKRVEKVKKIDFHLKTYDIENSMFMKLAIDS
jgi:hypothetical protein